MSTRIPPKRVQLQDRSYCRIQGLGWDATPILGNQTGKNMENDMETEVM